MDHNILSPCRSFEHVNQILPVTDRSVFIIIQAIFTSEGGSFVFPNLVPLMAHIYHHLPPQITTWEIRGIMVRKLAQFAGSTKCMKHAIPTGTCLKREISTNVHVSVQYKRLVYYKRPVYCVKNIKEQSAQVCSPFVHLLYRTSVQCSANV